MPPADGPLAPDELAAWRGMLAVHARVTRRLDAEMQAAHGLSVSAYEVLMFLADAPGHRLRMSEIADGVLLTRSGCTRLVDRLATRGYVVRAAADCDGRGLYATITPEGLAIARAARRTHLAGVRREFLARLDAADERRLGEIWQRFGVG
ncbi:MAG TPA: MarR family transcriptional regulator [Solirubrobacteraceae bacterium]|nr:MarR family transcriptional regulator [Solirubrobacteraceae bacterium]